MALLDQLHVDEPIAKDTAFITAKDRGGWWYPKEYLTDIFVAAELQFRVHTGKEVCHKIFVDKIVDILLQKSELRSKWNMLVEEFGLRSQKEDSSFSLIRSYHCLSKYSPKPEFAIYSAQSQCFLHADHYCIPLLPYVSVRLICTLQYFTSDIIPIFPRHFCPRGKGA